MPAWIRRHATLRERGKRETKEVDWRRAVDKKKRMKIKNEESCLRALIKNFIVHAREMATMS